LRIAHLTTVDISLRYLVLPQLEAVNELGGESIGISAPGEFVPELTARGIIHIPLTNSTRSVDLGKDAKTIFELWRILRSEKPDVLHTHTPKPGIYGRIVGRLAGVPVVVNTIHGLYATRDDPIIKRAIVYTLEAIAARFSDRELVQSAEDFKFVTNRRITRRDRTILLGNGVDLSRFDPARVDEGTRRDIRASIGAADGDIVVGSVGRLVAEKGFPELFEAAGKLSDNSVIVAIGPDEPDKVDGLQAGFIAAARELGIHLPGMQTNVDEWYAAMDIFVLASHREGFPRAAMEAASMGLPVIATDIRGCREVVDHGVNGLLVPVNDPEGLAGAITELASSPEKRRKMGKASREKALATFDERRIVDTVLKAQISALREKGHFHTLQGSDDFRLEVRRATQRDAAVIARLHADSIDTGFLRTLGVGFLRRLYSAMLDYDGATILVATDPYGPVAFVAGVNEVGAFYRHFATSKGFGAGISAAPRLIRPSSWRKVWETATYDGDHQETGAELLSMAVAGPYRGRGLGRSLSKKLLDELAGTGISRVKVVVGADNAPARNVYESVGFIERDAIEVHKGERSVVLVSDRGHETARPAETPG
jgi:glycosyltransferase involved in cell wall biosynthesis/GNAT superfamily N-acetyltransferase